MPVYTELLARIRRSYRDASNNFHAVEAAQKIETALDAFPGPLDELAAQIDKQRANHYPEVETFRIESANTLRRLDADLEVLKTAFESAVRADNQKIARTIIDQPGAVRKAKAQQLADRDMMIQISKLLDLAREDVKIAAAMPRPG